MQNCQYLQHTNGCNKYCCNYISKIDENNINHIKSNQRDGHSLKSKSTFLHNTKITQSSMNEDKCMNKKRRYKDLSGRRIAITELIHKIFGEEEVHTDMNFVTVSTLPLEHRAGYESTKKKKFYYKERKT